MRQVPGRSTFATKSPIKIATVVLVKSSTANRRPAVPGIFVVIKVCSTATKIRGVARARRAFSTNSAGIAKLLIKVALLRLGFPAPRAIPTLTAATKAMRICNVRGIRCHQGLALVLT